MSVRDAREGTGRHGLDERTGTFVGGERRVGVGQRVHFEALVAMGEARGGGFEAESVDLSPEGMRLRTAYLPQVGDKLLCRFDGMGVEIVAEGEVIWCREEVRGGEFGLRFVGYDDHAAEVLRDMCSALSVQRGEGPVAGTMATRGTRVRLHIEGLAAPMKARVRESASGEIQVGSNLEFLRVGRPLEVEDVDHGAKKQAMIDHVKVEVDPTTRVPQLVVALRMEGAAKLETPRHRSSAPPAGARAEIAPARAEIAPARAEIAPARAEIAPARAEIAPARAEIAPARAEMGPARAEMGPARAEMGPARAEMGPARPEAAGGFVRASTLPYGTRVGLAPDTLQGAPTGDDERLHARVSPAGSGSEHPATFAATTTDDEAADGDEQSIDIHPSDSSDAEEPEREGHAGNGGAALRHARDKAVRAGTQVAAVVGPALSGMGSRAKGAVSGWIASMRHKRAAKAEVQASMAPRRVTAPPPSGVLKADGRRLVRDRDDAGHAAAAEEPQSVVPVRSKRKAAAMGSALGLFAVLTLFAGYRIFGSVTAPVAAPTASEATNTAAAALALDAPPAASGVPTAAVPLFGATPLSTTEPVPAPPAADAPGADPSGAVAEQDDTGDDDDTADANGDPSAPASPVEKQWGQGTVKNPVVLRLKMDGEIEGIQGAAGAMGFTVSVPDRRALSSGTDLKRKDKRIASVQVVNNPHGAEVSVQFKDGVPAYLARSKGRRLEILLGTDSRKKVAEAKSTKRSKNSKKKSDSSAKSKTKKTASKSKKTTSKKTTSEKK